MAVYIYAHTHTYAYTHIDMHVDVNVASPDYDYTPGIWGETPNFKYLIRLMENKWKL